MHIRLLLYNTRKGMIKCEKQMHYDINTIGAYAGTYLDEDNTIDPTLVFHGISFTS